MASPRSPSSSTTRGRAEGVAEGVAQGVVDGQREMLLKLLRAKFVRIDDEDVAKVERADADALDRYLERILTADSVAAVLGG